MKNLKKQVKPMPATYKRLLLIAGFLFVFGLGLAVAVVQPGAVLVLLIVLAFVVLALLGESLYLWQAAKRREISKPVRMKRSPSHKEVQR